MPRFHIDGAFEALARYALAGLWLVAAIATSAALPSLGSQVKDSGLVFILPFLMFVFLLALGEDYNILVMTRIREEAHGLPLREAVVRAIGRTGSTVTSAGLILGGTFAVLGLAGGGAMAGVRAIGFGLAFGVLMDTFLVRTLLVPSTVILLGRWNWWPSALGRHDGPRGEGRPRDADAGVLQPAPAGGGASGG
jgi:RND superfamily putative drug exporter